MSQATGATLAGRDVLRAPKGWCRTPQGSSWVWRRTPLAPGAWVGPCAPDRMGCPAGEREPCRVHPGLPSRPCSPADRWAIAPRAASLPCHRLRPRQRTAWEVEVGGSPWACGRWSGLVAGAVCLGTWRPGRVVCAAVRHHPSRNQSGWSQPRPWHTAEGSGPGSGGPRAVTASGALCVHHRHEARLVLATTPRARPIVGIHHAESGSRDPAGGGSRRVRT
jgi:hypothetical protein